MKNLNTYTINQLTNLQQDSINVGDYTTYNEVETELDKYYRGAVVSNNSVFEALPPEVRELTEGFLQDLQNFHDRELYWNAEGLTESGEQEYLRLMEKVEMGYYEE